MTDHTDTITYGDAPHADSPHIDQPPHTDVPHTDSPHADWPHGDATPSPHVDFSHIDFHGPHHLDWEHVDKSHSDLRHGDDGPPTTDDPLERFSRRMVDLVDGVERHIAASHNVLAQEVIQGIANVSASLEELRRRVEALEREVRSSGHPGGGKGGPA